MRVRDRRIGGNVDDPESLTGSHLDTGSISAYLDGRLESGEKARVQGHLADCPECRREMTELVDLMKAHDRPRRRWPVVATGVAAAAAVALLISVPRVREAMDDPGALRAPEAATEREAVRSLPVISPPPDASLTREEVVFAWESAGEEAAYRLTMTDEEGQTVWRIDTDATWVDPPSDLELRPGQIYFWYVDAVLSDGTTATTGVNRLRLAP
jgi:hypothetical protein